MIATNVTFEIEPTQERGLVGWRGTFAASEVPTIDVNSLDNKTIYKIQLHDGRTAEMFISGVTQSFHTGERKIEIMGREPFR
jgi:hypothetical protein